MARKLRFQPENVCYHVVTRIAHREFFFDDKEKDIVVRLIQKVERFTGVRVIAFAIMSNHLHLLLFIEKPATLTAWENAGYFLGYDFEKFKDGDLYRVSENNVFTQAEVDEFRRLESLSALERYEMTRDELIERLRILMRQKPFETLMESWSKLRPQDLDGEYERQLLRMYDLSAFMKILKQDISQYYNYRHNHSGGLWEGRFKDSIIERSVEAMSSVATYIDLNAWRAKICDDPAEYRWCSWAAAIAGDELRREGYRFIYDSGADWPKLCEVHRQQLEHRMADDTEGQEEIEEKVFTSGAIIGSDSFVDSIVRQDEVSFPSHTSMMGCETSSVARKNAKTLSIPVDDWDDENVVRQKVKYFLDWVGIVNTLYNEALEAHERHERRRREEERGREIARLESENRMRNLIARL